MIFLTLDYAKPEYEESLNVLEFDLQDANIVFWRTVRIT